MNFNVFNKIVLSSILFVNVSIINSMKNPEPDSESDTAVVVDIPEQGRVQHQDAREAIFRRAVADAQRIINENIHLHADAKRQLVIEHLANVNQIADHATREQIYRLANAGFVEIPDPDGMPAVQDQVDAKVLPPAAPGTNEPRPRAFLPEDTEGGWMETAAGVTERVLSCVVDPNTAAEIVDERCVVS